MIKALKGNHPTLIFFVIFMGITLWIKTFMSPDISNPDYHMIFGNFLMSVIAKKSFMNVALNMVLTLIIAFLLIAFNRKNIIINQQTYLPAFFYVALISGVPAIQQFHPVVPGILFLLWAFDLIYNTYRSEGNLEKLFFAGFFIATSSLFYFPLIYMGIVIFISLTILRPFIWREWVAPILGMLTPFLFVFTFYYLSDSLNSFRTIVIYQSQFDPGVKFLEFQSILFLLLVLIILLISSINLIKNFPKKKIKTRRYFLINFWIFLLSLVIYFVFYQTSYELMYIGMVPLAFLFTDFFYSIKSKKAANFILLLFFMGLFYVQFSGIIGF